MKSKIFGRKRLHAAVLPVLWAAYSTLVPTSYAGVQTDGTMGGGAQTISGPHYQVPASVGRTVGGNLFHSFRTFNINGGESASFSGPTSIQNVLARVTGGGSSLINGRLTCEIPGANFFLINPKGVVFGPNAQLDVGGSFVVTTADYIKLGTDGRFDAANPAESVLSASAPSAFGFLGPVAPAPITIGQSAGPTTSLAVSEGKTVSVIAGPVQIRNGRIIAPGGSVHVVSVAGKGEVAGDATANGPALAVPQHLVRADAELKEGAQINTDGRGGGQVFIRSRNLAIEDSSLSAKTLGTQAGLGVDIDATGQVSLVRGQIDARSVGFGDAGSVSITAGSVVMDATGTANPVGIFTNGEAMTVPSDSGAVKLTLDITHTYDSDLVAALFAPDSSLVMLFAYVGGAGRNFSNTTFDDTAATPIAAGTPPFSGSFIPRQALGGFAGKAANGAWSLVVMDRYAGDAGTLNSARLTIGSSTFSAVGAPVAIPDGSGSGGLLFAVPRGRGGNITLRAATVDITGPVALSATSARGAEGVLTIDSPGITFNGRSAMFTVNNPGVGQFLNPQSISHDATLGQTSLALFGPNYVIPAERGRILGTNLFHSFSKFSLLAGETATFTGPGTITNILARVTGTEPSTIEGRLSTAIPNATLYLMNPNGVVFRGDASLNVGGSFVATTAHSIELGNNTFFSATDPANSPLSDGNPIGMSFVGSAPAAITVDGSTLITPAGKAMSLVAGGITVSGATISAPDGRVNLVSVGSAGSVLLDPSSLAGNPDVGSFAMLGPVTLKSDTTISADGDAGGRIVLRGQDLTMSGSANGTVIQSHTNGSGDGEGIDIDLRGSLSMSGATLVTRAFGSGAAGDIQVRAGSIQLSSTSMIKTASRETGTGAAGDVSVHATGALTLQDSSFISNTTFGPGDAGNIDVSAATVGIHSSSSISVATAHAGRSGNLRISSGALTLDGEAIVATWADPGVAGDAGSIRVDATDIAISEGAVIRSNGAPAAKEGGLSIRIAAKSLRLDNGGIEAINHDASASGGIEIVSAGELSLRNGGFIVGNTEAQQGGDIRVSAGRLTLDGRSQGAMSRIGLVSTGKGGVGAIDLTVGGDTAISGGASIVATAMESGAPGQIRLRTGNLRLDDGHITAAGEQKAAGGEIEITATGILLENRSEIISDTAGGTADAGNIHISGALEMKSSSRISSAPQGSGHGGAVTIVGPSLTLGGQDKDAPTMIDAGTLRDSVGGTGGLVQLEVDAIRLSGESTISAKSRGSGDSGRVQIAGAKEVHLSGPSSIDAGTSTSTAGKAGEIHLQAESLHMDSGATISATATGLGAGGLIDVTADRITLESGAMIRAYENSSTPGIYAGQIRVNAGAISASGEGTAIASLAQNLGVAGDVTVKAGRITLTDRAAIAATPMYKGTGGKVHVEASDTLELLRGAGITTSTMGPGNSGNLEIAAGTLRLAEDATIAVSTTSLATGNGGRLTIQARDLSVSGARIGADTFGIGSGGNMEITATNSISVSNQGSIAADVKGNGAGGDILIHTKSLLLTSGGQISAFTTGSGRGGTVDISATGLIRLDGAVASKASAIQAIAQGAGRAGDLHVKAASIEIRNSAFITARTEAAGNAGDACVTADRIRLTRGFITASATKTSTGAGGSVRVNAGTLRIDDAGLISASTYTARDGGSVIIDADSITLAGESGIVAETRGVNLPGRGGNVKITTDTLSVTGPSMISTATSSAGEGGSIRIEAGSLHLIDDATIRATTSGAGDGGSIRLSGVDLSLSGRSGIKAETTLASGGGRGGDIQIAGGRMVLLDQADISTSTTGSGRGGSISATIDGPISLSRAQIRSSSVGSGDGGSVSLHSGQSIQLRDGATIATQADQASGGNIVLRAADAIELVNGHISAKASNNGGNVTLMASQIVRLGQSDILAEAGQDGGSISIDPAYVILQQSRISANAVHGRGGDIRILVDSAYLPSADSQVTASSEFGVQGNVAITSPETNLTGALVRLSEALQSLEARLQERCGARYWGDVSSFIILGAGGLPLEPGAMPIFNLRSPAENGSGERQP